MLLVLGKELRDRVVLVGVTGAILICLCLLSGVLWGPMQEQFAALRDVLPAALLSLIPGGDMSSPTGWVNAQVMSLSAPGALIAVGVVSALRGTVGEETRGTLALLLGNGIGRATFAGAKFLAMLIHVALAAVLLAAGLWVSNQIWDLGLGTGQLLGGVIHAMVLAWLFGSLTAAIGLSTGRARLTGMASITVAATSFVIATFFPLSQSLAGWERASPWYYFSGANALAEGVNVGYLLVLLSMTLACFAISLYRFSRRDLKN